MSERIGNRLGHDSSSSLGYAGRWRCRPRVL